MNKQELEQLYDISIKSYDELLHIQKQHIDEIERLNNIINELEKYTNARINSCYENGATLGEFNIYNEYISIIKELKEKK